MTTLNLPYVRFTRQVSNGMPRTKYSYKAMQQDLLFSLKKTAWKEASCSSNAVTTVVNKVTQTDGEKDDSGVVTKQPTYTTFLDDKFDAYKQGGDADTSTATFCGYAGMVAYRFTLPTGYSSNITQVDIPLQTSRYLRSGLRVCIVLSDSTTPSTDWNVIRGDNNNSIVSEHSSTDCPEGVSSWGVLNQTVPILLDSKPQEGTVTFTSTDFPSLGTSTRYTYMYVYVSIEDYCDYWTWYSLSEPRYYSIEGSATLVASRFSVTFSGTEYMSDISHTMEIVKNGVIPSVWENDDGSQVHYVTVQRNGDPVAEGNIQMVVNEIVSNGGIINRVDILPPMGISGSNFGGVCHFACICGKGFTGTFPNLPGLLFYDCENNRLVNYSTTELPICSASQAKLDDEVYHYGIVRCLVNYDANKGFYFLPCIGRHVTSDVPEEGITYYPMLENQVEPVYPTDPTNENTVRNFYYFTYDKDNNEFSQARVDYHESYRLTSTCNTLYLIGMPCVVEDISSSQGEVMWIGVLKDSNNTDKITYIHPILCTGNVATLSSATIHGNAFNFSVRRSGATDTGTIRDLVSLPIRAYYNGGTSNYDHRAGVGVQIVGGNVTFQPSIAYQDSTQCSYTSTTNCNASLKIIVLTKDVGETEANRIWELNSSIEMTGTTFSGNEHVLHSSWSLSNGSVTYPNGNEFLISNIGSSPLKILNTFQTAYTAYPNNSDWLTEFPNNTSLWVEPDVTSFSIKRGKFPATTEYNLSSSAEGLRVCYGNFFAGMSRPVSGLTQRIGAACSLVGTTTIGLPDGTTTSIPCWQLVQSSLVIPFGCPRTWKAKRININWNRWTGDATSGSKVFVWLARNQFIQNHPSYLGKVAISTGGTVSGCELVGEIDPNSIPKNASFNIQELTSHVATIILTAFIDMDSFNPSQWSTMSRKGVGDISLNMKTMQLNDTNTCFVPDITLYG